jgi:hypothetical protein
VNTIRLIPLMAAVYLASDGKPGIASSATCTLSSITTPESARASCATFECSLTRLPAIATASTTIGTDPSITKASFHEETNTIAIAPAKIINCRVACGSVFILIKGPSLCHEITW